MPYFGPAIDLPTKFFNYFCRSRTIVGRPDYSGGTSPDVFLSKNQAAQNLVDNKSSLELLSGPITALSLSDGASEFLEALRAESQRLTDFNSLFGTSIIDTGDVSSTDEQILNDLVSEPSFDRDAFLAALPNAASLLSQLKTDDSKRTLFNALFREGLSTGTPTVGQRQVLFEIVASPDYQESVFLDALTTTNNLLNSFKGFNNNTKRNAFNSLFGVNISSSLTYVPTPAERQILFSLTAQAGYDQNIFVNSLVPANNLMLALRTNASARAAYNSLYNQDLAASGTPTQAQRQGLFQTVALSGYDQNSFIRLIVLAGALQADEAKRTAFNSLFDQSLASSGAPTDDQRSALAGVTGAPGYNLNVFLGLLVPSNDLLAALRLEANAETLATFNAIYNASLAASGPITSAQKDILFGVTGDPAYDKEAFLNSLGGYSDLLGNLRADAAKLNAYNVLYGQTLAATGDPTFAQRDQLLAISRMAGFNPGAFLNSLVPTYDLLAALRANATQRNAFNIVFNIIPALTSGAPTVVPTSQQREVLLGIVGAPGYDKTTFLSIVVKVSSLFTALKGSSYRDKFNVLFATTLPTGTNVTDEAIREILFGIAGTPGYVQSTFLSKTLLPAYTLLTELRKGTTQGLLDRRNAFNALFNETVQNTVTSNLRGILFGITGDAAYVQATFLGNVIKTKILVDNLLADSSQLAAFDSLFNVTLADPLDNTLRGVVFGITGTTGYVEAPFRNSLIRTNDLWTALKNDAAFLSSFNMLYASTISTAPLTAAQRKSLSDLTAVTGYTESNFVASVNLTGALLDGLRADSNKLLAYKSLYGQTIPAAGGITGTTLRASLFGVTAEAGFVLNDYLARIIPANNLLTALRPSATRVAFNTLFLMTSTALASSGTPSALQRRTLFGLVAEAGYDQAKFIALLVPAKDLLTDVRGNTSKRSAFNNLFLTPATALASSGQLSADQRQALFSIVGDTSPLYNRTKFNSFLVSTSNLVVALRANPSKLTAFNANAVSQGSNLQTTGPISEAQKDVLFGITSAAGYNQTNFINSL